MQHTQLNGTYHRGTPPSRPRDSQEELSALTLPPRTTEAEVSPASRSMEQRPPLPETRDRLTLHKIQELITPSLRKASSAVLLWTGQKLRELGERLWSPEPKGPVDAIVTRALAGPAEVKRGAKGSSGRTWAMFAKQQSLEFAARMEPNLLREVRKLIRYEQGSFQKLGLLFCQLADGLPRLDGKHITPERVRSLPYEYNDPYLQRLYLQLRRLHFPKRSDVDDYKVVWRDRPMATANGPGTLRDTLGYIEFKTRTIHIGREMSHPDAVKWLPALIHHELCHAILVDFLTPTQDAHDEWFKRINQKHKDTPAFQSWTGWRACFESYHKLST